MPDINRTEGINGAANLLGKAAATALEGAARLASLPGAHYGDQSTVALEIAHAARWAANIAEIATGPADGNGALRAAQAAAAAAAIYLEEFSRSADKQERGRLIAAALYDAAKAAGYAETAAIIAEEQTAAGAAGQASLALQAAADLMSIPKLIAECRAAAGAALDAAEAARKARHAGQ